MIFNLFVRFLTGQISGILSLLLAGYILTCIVYHKNCTYYQWKYLGKDTTGTFHRFQSNEGETKVSIPTLNIFHPVFENDALVMNRILRDNEGKILTVKVYEVPLDFLELFNKTLVNISP